MAKRSGTSQTSTGVQRFDPVEFLETAAKGRIVSTHQKKQVIFAQGDVADAVIYIKRGKVKVTVLATAPPMRRRSRIAACSQRSRLVAVSGWLALHEGKPGGES
jgi:hypothetical protein